MTAQGYYLLESIARQKTKATILCMPFAQDLRNLYPNVEEPFREVDIPRDLYLVYVLTVNTEPIVVGSGMRNRARVIFDSEDSVTRDHIKALIVRLYVLFSAPDAVFQRFLIRCKDRQQAREFEKDIQRRFGGNNLRLPQRIYDNLFYGLAEDSLARMALRMALCSAFDGIRDIRKWRRDGILDNDVWREIELRLRLPN